MEGNRIYEVGEVDAGEGGRREACTGPPRAGGDERSSATGGTLMDGKEIEVEICGELACGVASKASEGVLEEMQAAKPWGASYAREAAAGRSEEEEKAGAVEETRHSRESLAPFTG